jgi:hypothetical protein
MRKAKPATAPRRTQAKPDVPDIDFSGGVRGKYAARFAEGTNLVVISPEIAEIFPTPKARVPRPRKHRAQ